MQCYFRYLYKVNSGQRLSNVQSLYEGNELTPSFDKFQFCMKTASGDQETTNYNSVSVRFCPFFVPILAVVEVDLPLPEPVDVFVAALVSPPPPPSPAPSPINDGSTSIASDDGGITLLPRICTPICRPLDAP